MKNVNPIKERLKAYGNWKTHKRPTFRFYFVLVVTLVVMISVSAASNFSSWIAYLGNIESQFEILLLLVGASLIIAFLLSAIVSRSLLRPIARLQDAMQSVTEGDFSVRMKENSRIEEVENINHSFNIMMKELCSNAEMQKDFMSNVSHEFKTPLSAIEGYATLLQDKTLTPEESEEYTREILSTTKLMSELVSNILLISKIENQVVDYKKAKFSLDEQIRHVVVLLEPKWSKKNINIDANLDNVAINSSQSLLMHVWRNLIENAIKFSPENGNVTINLTKKGGKVVFSVQDEGCGVKDKTQIFNKFYQEDTSRKQQGTGLGLTLVKKILDIMGGDIQVENLSPKGCVFTVALTDV